MLTRRHKDEGASARDASPLRQQLPPLNCARSECGVKRFATLQAHLALAGYSLNHAADGYYVITRWDQVLRYETMDQAEQFHQGVAR